MQMSQRPWYCARFIYAMNCARQLSLLGLFKVWKNVNDRTDSSSTKTLITNEIMDGLIEHQRSCT